MYIFYLLHKNLEYCMDNSGSGRSAICPSHIDIGLAKKFIQGFSAPSMENPNELLGQPNINVEPGIMANYGNWDIST